MHDNDRRRSELIDRFDDERSVTFKDETYVVRDNGAVLRRARATARVRKLDEIWTFGSPNKQSGYLVLSEHVVHQIVATAFHGPRPSQGHVVDHIDTNRHNNRPDNLRWVTRLENILLNPITRARIEYTYGSLEAFFANPGAQSVPNMEWMRAVTKEEAARSLARLRAWATEGTTSSGGRLGDWVFAAPSRRPKTSVSFDPWAWTHTGASAPSDMPRAAETDDRPSLTPGAVQRRWRTPTEFPLCPPEITALALDDYLAHLSEGAVFARNQYGESTVVEAGKASDGSLSVVCATPSGVKEWSRARVYVEGDAICHESDRMFFTREGAMKAHLSALGVPFDEALYESIDDYA